jgi:hypothetical protein
MGLRNIFLKKERHKSIRQNHKSDII